MTNDTSMTTKCLLKPWHSIDEKPGVEDVVFLFQFAEKDI